MGLSKVRVLLGGAAIALCLAYYAKPNFPDSAGNHGLKTIVGLSFKIIEIVSYTGEVLGFSRVNITRAMLGVSAVFDKQSDTVKMWKTTMDGVEVVVFEPTGQTEGLRPGIVHYHGGGWVVLSPELYAPFVKEVVDQTKSVVVSVRYRRAPEYLYPVPLEDCLTATRYFLKNAEKFGVDSKKVGVKGDSAGGNLAMAAALKLSKEKDLPALKFMSLDYPALQAFDYNLPCYRKYENGPGFLTKRLMIRYALLYAFGNMTYFNMFYNNQHVSKAMRESAYGQSVSERLLLEESDVPPRGGVEYGNEKDIPKEVTDVILDPYYAPLMASDEDLVQLPPAYIFNAEFDVLRDDGFILASRLRKVGVKVVHQYLATEEHGFINFVTLDPAVRMEVQNFANFFNKTLGLS